MPPLTLFRYLILRTLFAVTALALALTRPRPCPCRSPI